MRPRLRSLVPFLSLAVAGCGISGERAQVDDMQGSRPIEQVLAEHAPRLMEIEGVVGVYQGLTDDGVPCLKVMVVEETAELRRRIPERLEGHPVLLRETGEIGPRGGDRSRS